MIKSSISFPLWIGWQYPKNISRLLVKEYYTYISDLERRACFVLTNFAIDLKCILRTISAWLKISKGSYFIVILYDFIYKWKLYSLLKKLSVFGTFQKEGRLSKMTIPSSNWLIKLYRTKSLCTFPTWFVTLCTIYQNDFLDIVILKRTGWIYNTIYVSIL